MGNCCRAQGDVKKAAGGGKKASRTITYSHSPSPPPYFPANYPYNHHHTNSLNKYTNYKNKNVKNALVAGEQDEDDCYQKALVREEDIEKSAENLAPCRKRLVEQQQQATPTKNNYQLIAVSLTPQQQQAGRKKTPQSQSLSRRGADNSQIITHLNAECDIESLSASPSCTRAKLMSYQKLQQQIKTAPSSSSSPSRPTPVKARATKNIFEELNTFNSAAEKNEQEMADLESSKRETLMELDAEPVRLSMRPNQDSHSTPLTVAKAAPEEPQESAANLKASPVPMAASPAPSSPRPDEAKPASKTIFVLRKKNKLASPSLNSAVKPLDSTPGVASSEPELKKSKQTKTTGKQRQMKAENELDSSVVSSSSSVTNASSFNGSAGPFSSIFNWKNYRSLQKSKQSIRNLEDSMKLSHSIEQWLNDFGKIQMSGATQRTGSQHRGFGGSMRLNRLNSHSTKKLRTQLFRNDLETEKRGGGGKNTRLSVLNEREISLEVVETTVEQPPPKMELSDEDEAEDLVSQAPEDEQEDELESDVFRNEAQFKLFLEQLLRTCSKLTSVQSTPGTPPAKLKATKAAKTTATPKTPTVAMATAPPANLSSSINVIKLVDTIGMLIKYNHPRRMELLEREMSGHMSQFFVPKSDDVTDLLKWLLSDRNFELSLCRPVFNESLTTPDHLTRCQQVNNVFLLVARGLSVRLVEEAAAFAEPFELFDEHEDYDDLDALTDTLEHDPARLTAKTCHYLQFELEPSVSEEPVFRGKLAICGRLIRKALNNEKKLVEKCARTIEIKNFESLEEQEEFARRQQEHLDTYRQTVLQSANFRGAQCLLNIKRRQVLNRRTLTSSANLQSLRQSQQPPAPAKRPTSTYGGLAKRQSKQGARVNSGGSNNSSTITTTSSQCSTPSPSSPSSSVSTESSPSSKSASPVYNPMVKGPSSGQTSSDNYVSYAELNERLFACLLSNFSCQLVESFLSNSSATPAPSAPLQTGFIRKQMHEKSFMCVNVAESAAKTAKKPAEGEEMATDTAGKFQLNLNVDTNTIKLCLRLDHWPACFERGYFARERSLTKWPSRRLLEHVAKSTCLISYSAQTRTAPLISSDHTGLLTTLTTGLDQDSSGDYTGNPYWQVDTRLAELTLFKYLTPTQRFLFYYVYLLFNNLRVDMTSAYEHLARLDNVPSENLTSGAEFHLFDFLNERMFVHHFFRFLELYNVGQPDEQQPSAAFLMLFDAIRKFSEHLRSVIEQHGQLNRPNYFDLSRSILETSVYQHLLMKANLVNKNLDDLRKFTDCSRPCLLATLNGFEQLLSSSLYGKLGLKAALAPAASTQPSSGSVKEPSALLNALNTFLELTKIRLTLNKQASRSLNASAMTLSPLLNSSSSMQSSQLKLKSSSRLLERLIERQAAELLGSKDSDSSDDSDDECCLTGSMEDGVSPFSPLAPHFSTSSFVYEYIYEFVRELYEHFRTKRDNFKINEQLLLDIHESVIKHNLSSSSPESAAETEERLNQSLEMNEFIRSIQSIYHGTSSSTGGNQLMINGYLADGLLMRKYEEYAECVHKYLPQVRQHNKFLLFHYIWTMQVQYLAPFFNYLCDSFVSFSN